MGQKVHPISFRIGTGITWQSRWFAKGQDYKKFLFEDITLRQELEEKYKFAGVHAVEIERLPKAMTIRLSVSRPGIVIGRGGSGIEEAKNFVIKKLKFNPKDPTIPKIDIVVEEIKNPELSAKLVALRIANELERRLPHRRVITKTVERVMAVGAKGVRVVLAGRIEGANIARKERYQDGSVPTQSLRSDIDYAQARSLLKKGYVGIKVWIHTSKEKSNRAT